MWIWTERVCAGSGPNYYDVSSINAEGKPVSAKRRFDDLVQLHEDLKSRFRGCVIPFRPGKTKTNSTVLMHHAESFLKERAFAVKCYLNKIVQHPEMKHSAVCLHGSCSSVMTTRVIVLGGAFRLPPYLHKAVCLLRCSLVHLSPLYAQQH
jgi:hypothetical protein